MSCESPDVGYRLRSAGCRVPASKVDQLIRVPLTPMAADNQSEAVRRPPLYLETAQTLREMIASGEFGTVLPSQDRLSEVLQVSRPTLREAIRVLEQSGLVSSRQGAATTINPVPKVEAGLEELFSTSELLARGGHRSGTSFLDVRRALGTSGTYPMFTGRPVIVVERVRTADDVPFVFSLDVIADAGYDEAELRDMIDRGSLMAWLEERAGRVAYAKTVLSATVAERTLSERLEVQEGTALLFMEEFGYSAADEPIFYSHDFYRCDVTEFHILRRRGLA
jgi:GntR family transcriptional regulator